MTKTKKQRKYNEWAAKQDPRSTPENPYLSTSSIRAAPDSNFNISLRESLRRANMNLSDSAHGLTNALGHMVAHPVETGGTILSLGQSLGQNLIPGDQGNEAMAQNLAKHYHDRYGSWQGFKQNFAEDPFPMVLDVAGASALAKPIATGAINTTRAGIDAAKRGIDTAKTNITMRTPDRMDPDLVWHGGTLTDDVPIALGKDKYGQTRLGLHASSHPSGPIMVYAKPKLDKNINLTKEYNKLTRSQKVAFHKKHKQHYGTPWNAEPTLTEFTVQNAKPFFYNKPQKDVVNLINENIKTLKNEIKLKEKNNVNTTGKVRDISRIHDTTTEIFDLNKVIKELSDLRDGKISLQTGVTETQLNILQDLGYQIIRPKHPTLKSPGGPSGSLDKNHVLIIDKNLPRRNVKDWEAAADRGRAQRDVLGKQDMRNRQKSTTEEFFEGLFKYE